MAGLVDSGNFDAVGPTTIATWNSGTALNTNLTMTTSGMDTVAVTIYVTGSITGGAISFSVFDGANFIPVKCARSSSYNVDSTYQLAGVTGIQGWTVPAAGYPQFQLSLSSSITGTGSVLVTTIVSSAPDVSIVTAGIDPNSLLPTHAANTMTNNILQSRYFCPAALTVQAVKTSAGKIHAIRAINNVASARYLKLYNLAQGSVVVGTTTPFYTLLLAASSMTVLGPELLGIYFSTAISCVISTTYADTGDVAPAASDVLTQIDYI